MREIALHILDLAQNSVRAEATQIKIGVKEDLAADLLQVVIKDNGRGMPAELLAKATDPFHTTRTTRRVGLGLPLVAAATAACGGQLKIASTPGQWTLVEATWQHSHIDRAPLGDIAGTIWSLVVSYPEIAWYYEHRYNEAVFTFASLDFKEQLGEIPLNHPQVAAFMQKYLKEGIADLRGKAF